MRKGVVILLIIAAALTILGGAIFTVGVVAATNENSSFIDSKYQDKTYESTDAITGISITGDVAYIKLLPYDKEGYLVKCFEEKKAYHSVSVKDGILCIEKRNEREWYDHISFFSKPTLITVYIPAGEYSSLTIRSSTGDIFVEQDFTFNKTDISCSTGDVVFLASTESTLSIKASTGNVTLGDGSRSFTHGDVSLSTSTGDITAKALSCNDVKVSVSTGKTDISNMACNSLSSTGNTGELSMSDVIAKDSISVKRSTGDVKLIRCDAAELDIVTDTGDVTGSLLSPKVFIYNTDTGDINLPDTTTGGTCRITTDTGDIKIGIAK